MYNNNNDKPRRSSGWDESPRDSRPKPSRFTSTSNSYNPSSSRSSRSSNNFSNKNSSFNRYNNNNDNTPLTENPPITKFTKNFLDPLPSNLNLSPESLSKFRTDSSMILKGTNIPPPILSFKDLLPHKLKFNNTSLFPTELISFFDKENYTNPTPIQSQGWSMALGGRDMVGIAMTGSGKTLSFVLPGLVHCSFQPKLRKDDGPIMLVLAPTRELCIQIYEVVEKYARFFNLNSLAIYGGVSYYAQKQKLRSGVEVLIATPGRLIDLVNQKSLTLSRTTFLVLDEADRMLDMGFEPQLRQIIPNTDKRRQTLMWSATWPKEVKNLAESYMNDYIQVNVGNIELTANKNIKQEIVICDDREKRSILLQILNDHTIGDVSNLNSNNNDRKFIIFCKTKSTCDRLSDFLEDKRYKCASLHGDKSQERRNYVVNDFKSNKKNILIATDVASRGLDVKNIYMVINYDLPTNVEDYVHRIGRTSRGDSKDGRSISLFTEGDGGIARELIKVVEESGNKVPNKLKEMIPKGGGYGNKGRGGGNQRYHNHRRW